MKKTVIIIPARYQSTRLPGKPLLEVKNKPIIQYVYEVALQSKLANEVIIATDDERIYDNANNFGAKCEMTSVEHKCGSDRIAEIAKKHTEYDYIINLQGDEPQITSDVVDLTIETLIENENTDISTLVRQIYSKEQINNPNCVKCVFDNNFNALYFSRAPIPYERNKDQSPYYAHIGIYGYKRKSLIELTQLKQTNLENQESLEQLRALQNGMKIKVAITDLNPTGIDTIEDYEKFKREIEKN